MEAPAVALSLPERPEVSVVVLATGTAPHLLGCLGALATRAQGVPFEVLVVLNGVNDRCAAAVARSVSGVRTLRSRVNRGFAGGCNLAASEARGRYLALLNDDALVSPGWLDALVDRLEHHPRAGAAGSRLLHADGTLQEAGQILWADGSTSGVGRGLPAGSGGYEWARRVDYCSGSSLLVRRELWEELGGLDESYFPAYCEDVDLCLRIAERGGEVWYEPRSVVRHLESRSTSPRYKTFLIERNRVRLVSRWSDELRRRLPPAPDDPAACRRAVLQAMGGPRPLLVVDDRIPSHAMGAGYSRMFDAAAELTASGRFHVAIHPTETADGDGAALGSIGVEIVREPLLQHLARPETDYDVVVVSRPNNYEQSAAELRAALPGAPIVYDAEALFFRRAERQVAFAGSEPERVALQAVAETSRALEQQIVKDADAVVCVSYEEAEIVRQLGAAVAPVVKLPLLAGIESTTSTFGERADLLFVSSWAAGEGSPNVDGLAWFLAEVLPLVHERAPWVRLRVTGGDPPRQLLDAAGYGVVFEGQVRELRSLYEQARVVVVPLRFGSGVKIKTIEALQHEVPVVATTVGAEGIDVFGTGAVRVCDAPAGFAEAVLQLVSDPDAWDGARARLRSLREQWASHRADRPSWTEIVEDVRSAHR